MPKKPTIIDTVTVGVKIIHIAKRDKTLHQDIFIYSYMDYFMTDTYKFYRNLKDFIDKFYLDYPIKGVTAGTNQYKIVYDISEVENVEYKNVDQQFDFKITPKDKRDCNTCEYIKQGEKCRFCEFYKRDITEMPEHCMYWYEK